MLLSDLYLDAIKNKEKKISLVHDLQFHDVLQIASDRWVAYEPKKEEAISVGVDSSWNKKSFQGIDLFVIDCVTVTSSNDILNSTWDYGVGNITGDYLTSKAMMMEIDLSILALEKKPDIICIDGSILSNLVHNKNTVYATRNKDLFDMTESGSTFTVFISKNSTTKSQFKKYGSKVADIYYFNKLGFHTGFSLPNKNSLLSGLFDIVEIYVRLSSYVPLIKLEIVNKPDISQQEIQKLINMLYYHSVKGYPYCLKLAHKSCKITNHDVRRLASLYGLKNEFGSRDSLSE